MLTLFTTPKPFKGQIAVAQRNALRSWTLLDPGVEVIVFGDDEGTAEACQELNLRHEAHVERDEFGVKILSYIFDRAQGIARNDYVCFSNCDIILPSAFARGLEQVMRWRSEFMMIGRRWDVDITEAIDFANADWEQIWLETALRSGRQRGTDWIDYFAFKRGLCKGLPPFAVGRPCWDLWTVWWMRHRHIPVVDASPVVLAVHQNHDYSHHPQGVKGVREGKELLRNRALAGSWRHLCTIEDASHVLGAGGVRRSYRHWGLQFQREWTHLRNRVLVATGPLRNRLGLHRRRAVGG
jgi:hypothetical protein